MEEKKCLARIIRHGLFFFLLSFSCQLHHEATIINLLETIMFHQVGLCVQTLVLKGHNNMFINRGGKRDCKQKAGVLKTLAS